MLRRSADLGKNGFEVTVANHWRSWRGIASIHAAALRTRLLIIGVRGWRRERESLSQLRETSMKTGLFRSSLTTPAI